MELSHATDLHQSKVSSTDLDVQFLVVLPQIINYCLDQDEEAQRGCRLEEG